MAGWGKRRQGCPRPANSAKRREGLLITGRSPGALGKLPLRQRQPAGPAFPPPTRAPTARRLFLCSRVAPGEAQHREVQLEASETPNITASNSKLGLTAAFEDSYF